MSIAYDCQHERAGQRLNSRDQSKNAEKPSHQSTIWLHTGFHVPVGPEGERRCHKVCIKILPSGERFGDDRCWVCNGRSLGEMEEGQEMGGRLLLVIRSSRHERFAGLCAREYACVEGVAGFGTREVTLMLP